MSVSVHEKELMEESFYKGAGGAWYYGDNVNHIHLVGSTRGTNVEVQHVSIKIGNMNLGNLPELPSGRFDITYRANEWGIWKNQFQDALLATEIGGE